MKDCNGKTIRLGSRLQCVNDMDEGKIYKVESFSNTLCIKMDDAFLPLRDFNMEEGCLMDFKIVEKTRASKFDTELFYDGDTAILAVSKQRHTLEDALLIASQEFGINEAQVKVLPRSDQWVKFRAGINEDGEPTVGWWIESKDNGRSCPCWCFECFEFDIWN